MKKIIGHIKSDSSSDSGSSVTTDPDFMESTERTIRSAVIANSPDRYLIEDTKDPKKERT